jgi:hypothetical protein
MSRYDVLRKQKNKLQLLNQSIRMVPAVLLIGLAVAAMRDTLSPFFNVSLCCFGLLVLPNVVGLFLKWTFPNYRRLLAGLHKVELEIRYLASAIQAIYNKYPERMKGEQFKRIYGLAGKNIRECEERLAAGMSRERKEVFVTCFMRGEEVVRATASIGSLNRCSASDSPYLWKKHIERLGCTEIRNYHNHTVNNNRTAPSWMDHKTCSTIEQLLEKHGEKLRSYIIYWNQIGEWRILQYDAGKHWLVYEHDAADQLADMMTSSEATGSAQP